MSARATAAVLAGLSLVCALLLALPARTVTSAYVNDLLLFLDGAHRVAWGQVPNRDFHTALGLLAYYIPAAGLWISGQLGGALPVGMALLIVLFVPLLVHVLVSRLRPVLALALGAFLVLVLAAPINLGDSLSSITFAMYYNRIGWVALALLAVMYLRPRRQPPLGIWLDAATAAILVVLLIYLKITYAPVALAFVIFMLLDRQQWRWAALALLLIAVAMAVVELFWRGSWLYLQDLLETARVSGQRDPMGYVYALLRNLSDLLVFGIFAGLALTQTRSWRDLLFYIFCSVAGLLILMQNAHNWGIITLFAGAAVAAETLLRDLEQRGRRLALSPGAPLLFLFMVLPGLGSHTVALMSHFTMAVSGWGEPLGLPGLEQVRFGRLWSRGDQGFTEKYIGTFGAGADALAQAGVVPERVLVLDFANPFSAGLNLAPPKGDLSWMHWGRNINAAVFVPPEQLFADVMVVMVPTVGINVGQLEGLYGAYIAQNFVLAGQTELWRVYVRPPQPGAPA
ncbi:hypothetical protein [Devosia sp. 1566]|uniref:hypothetical protein n=1 Tax=Devosia sp. 1566 TaxID=2499144 RepID=UPI000FDA47EB|nr:hypothetical protein [Devosia sp. 1566]